MDIAQFVTIGGIVVALVSFVTTIASLIKVKSAYRSRRSAFKVALNLLDKQHELEKENPRSSLELQLKLLHTQHELLKDLKLESADKTSYYDTNEIARLLSSVRVEARQIEAQVDSVSDQLQSRVNPAG